MVELSATEALAGAVGGGLALLLLLLLLFRARRRRKAMVRRLAAVVARLEDPGARARDERDSVSRLEQLAQSTVLRVGDAEASFTRLAGALAVVGPGVVVCDDAGDVVHRSGSVEELVASEEGRARLQGPIDDVLAAAATTGARDQRRVELIGPPTRTLVVSGHPLDDGRRGIGAVAVVEDVSDRRRLDLMRQDLLANITTELKAPVAALGLLAATLATEDDPSVARRLAQRLSGEAHRTGRVIDDIAELSRLDTGTPAGMEPVPVHVVVAQAVEEVRLSSEASAIVIDARDSSSDLSVTGDRRQLVLAVRHLIDNAVRFSPDGARVGVEVARSDGTVEVAVSDVGLGVAAVEMDRIFERFYRVGDAGAHDPGGSGLGLAIVSQVAAAHGGELVVESTKGAGSVFTLRLPAA